MNSLFERDYQQELSALHYTPEQKARIAQNTLCVSTQAQSRPRKPHTLRRTALIAVAAAALLVVSAGAAGILKTAVEALSPVFGGSDAQTEIIDKIGVPIGASDTVGGVTITADAIIGDKYNAAIVYTISRDDGQPILPDGVPAQRLQIGGLGGVKLLGFGGRRETARVSEGENGTLQYVQIINTDTPIEMGTVTVEFDDICYWDGNDEAVTLLPGHWKFNFDISYEDSSVTLAGGETFQQHDMIFTIDEVTLSPVSVSVAYTVNDASWASEPEHELAKMYMFENVEILLTKTDGTVLDFTNASGGLTPQPQDDKTLCTKGEVFDEIIPLEEMESISIGGVVYSITTE